MKFVELAEGISINVDEIEAVSKKNQLNSVVQTHHNVYHINMPYEALLKILSGKVGGKQEVVNIMKEMGSFSG